MNDEAWTRYVSLTVVALAIATTLASFKATGYASRVMLSQAQASDAWAFYQAKSVKQRMAETDARHATGDEAARAAADSARYRAEEKELLTRAQHLETERDVASRREPPLGFAIASLQVAIALAAIALIAKRKLIWAASCALGVLGIGYVIYGVYGVT